MTKDIENDEVRAFGQSLRAAMKGAPLEGEVLPAEPKTFATPASWALVGEILGHDKGPVIEGEIVGDDPESYKGALDLMTAEEVYAELLRHYKESNR